MPGNLDRAKPWTVVIATVVLAACGHPKPIGGTPDGGVDPNQSSGDVGGNGGATPDARSGTETPTDMAGADAGADDAGADADADDTEASDAGAVDAAFVDATTETGAPPPRSCDGTEVVVCPTLIPSYARDIVPIFDSKCNTCHRPGPDLPWPLISYKTISGWAPDIASTLAYCTMPPPDAGAPPLTTEELQNLAGWLACGAPNN